MSEQMEKCSMFIDEHMNFITMTIYLQITLYLQCSLCYKSKRFNFLHKFENCLKNHLRSKVSIIIQQANAVINIKRKIQRCIFT